MNVNTLKTGKNAAEQMLKQLRKSADETNQQIVFFSDLLSGLDEAIKIADSGTTGMIYSGSRNSSANSFSEIADEDNY